MKLKKFPAVSAFDKSRSKLSTMAFMRMKGGFARKLPCQTTHLCQGTSSNYFLKVIV